MARGHRPHSATQVLLIEPVTHCNLSTGNACKCACPWCWLCCCPGLVASCPAKRAVRTYWGMNRFPHSLGWFRRQETRWLYSSFSHLQSRVNAHPSLEVKERAHSSQALSSTLLSASFCCISVLHCCCAVTLRKGVKARKHAPSQHAPLASAQPSKLLALLSRVCMLVADVLWEGLPFSLVVLVPDFYAPGGAQRIYPCLECHSERGTLIINRAVNIDNGYAPFQALLDVV